MKVSQVKQLVAKNNGEVKDVGWETFGDHKKAFIEAQYTERNGVPFIAKLETSDSVVVDTDWDEENNGVMYEVTVSER